MWNLEKREFVALRWFFFLYDTMTPSGTLFDEESHIHHHNKNNQIFENLDDLTISGITEEQRKTELPLNQLEDNLHIYESLWLTQ